MKAIVDGDVTKVNLWKQIMEKFELERLIEKFRSSEDFEEKKKLFKQISNINNLPDYDLKNEFIDELQNLKVDAIVFDANLTDDEKEEQWNLNEKSRVDILFKRPDISTEVEDEFKDVDKFIADYCVDRFNYLVEKLKEGQDLYSRIKICETHAQDKFDAFNDELTQLKALNMKDLIQAYWAQIGSNPSSDDIENAFTRKSNFSVTFFKNEIELYNSWKKDSENYPKLETLLDKFTSATATVQEKEEALDQLQALNDALRSVSDLKPQLQRIKSLRTDLLATAVALNVDTIAISDKAVVEKAKCDLALGLKVANPSQKSDIQAKIDALDVLAANSTSLDETTSTIDLTESQITKVLESFKKGKTEDEKVLVKNKLIEWRDLIKAAIDDGKSLCQDRVTTLSSLFKVFPANLNDFDTAVDEDLSSSSSEETIQVVEGGKSEEENEKTEEEDKATVVVAQTPQEKLDLALTTFQTNQEDREMLQNAVKDAETSLEGLAPNSEKYNELAKLINKANDLLKVKSETSRMDNLLFEFENDNSKENRDALLKALDELTDEELKSTDLQTILAAKCSNCLIRLKDLGGFTLTHQLVDKYFPTKNERKSYFEKNKKATFDSFGPLTICPAFKTEKRFTYNVPVEYAENQTIATFATELCNENSSVTLKSSFLLLLILLFV